MGFADYERYDGLGLAGLVRGGELKAEEVLEAAIERVEALNPALNARPWPLASPRGRSPACPMP